MSDDVHAGGRTRNKLAALHLIHRCVDAMRRAEDEYHASGNFSRDRGDFVRAVAVLTEAGVLDDDGFLMGPNIPGGAE